MSSTLKRQNHRIHPCNQERKSELVRFLINRYSGKNILIVTSNEHESLKNELAGADITLISDSALAQTPDLRCDVLISYDLPDKAIVYMSRLARSGEYALIVLGAEDQKRLYPIELLNGRTIIQEVIAGFEPNFGISAEKEQKAIVDAERAARKEKFAQKSERQKERSVFKNDRDDRRQNGAQDEMKKGDKWKRNDSKSRFIGKDENGKPIFEGKTRDRNHYIDGTPRTPAEKAYKTPYSSKPKFFGKDKPQTDKEKTSDDSKKVYDKKPYEGKKSFDKDKKPYGDKKSFGDKEKKPFDGKKTYSKDDKKPYGEKKSFGDKKPYGDKKSFGDKKPYGDRKPSYDKPAKSVQSSDNAKPASSAPEAPKRAPRRISVKSLKPSEKKGE